MQITVVGRHVAEQDPELGRLHLEASRTAHEPARPYDEVVALAQTLTAELEELDAAGALASWTVSPVRTRSWTPHGDDGRPRRPEHTASATITAEFHDPATLSAFAARHGSDPGLSQHGVSWSLTDESERALRDRATTGAVADARERARVMAQAADAGPVRCVAVADPGLLGVGRPEDAGGEMMLLGGPPPAGVGRAAHGEVALHPHPIEISVEVHAIFEADEQV